MTRHDVNAELARHGVTKLDLASKAGMSRWSIYSILSGRLNPTSAEWDKIETALTRLLGKSTD